jgi:hypothetical protein
MSILRNIKIYSSASRFRIDTKYLAENKNPAGRRETDIKLLAGFFNFISAKLPPADLHSHLLNKKRGSNNPAASKTILSTIIVNRVRAMSPPDNSRRQVRTRGMVKRNYGDLKGQLHQRAMLSMRTPFWSLSCVMGQ